MLNHHPFWLAGGAGGVDDIGQIGGFVDRSRIFHRLACGDCLVICGYQCRRFSEWLGICRQCRQMMLLGQHTRGLDILQNKINAFRGICRCNGYISGAGFQHGQHTNHHFRTAVKIKGDWRVGLQRCITLLLIALLLIALLLIMPADSVCQLICPFVELAVGQRFALKHQRHIVWCYFHLCFKQLLQGFVLRVGNIGLVPGVQQGMAFLLTEKHYGGVWLVWVTGYGIKNTLKLTKQTQRLFICQPVFTITQFYD
ncbi:hypothetical protein Xenpb_03837 [Xenorhabdus sp. PB62.4]|nr:hypothetical protein [Xenorhabdus sp. PB62.4]